MGSLEISSCPFCAIIQNNAPAKIEMRWLDTIALVPLNPVTKGHILIVPKHHVIDAVENPVITGVTMMRTVEFITKKQLFYPYGACNIITSLGREATQTVGHLHIHVVPRERDDELHLPWTNQKVEGDD